jgi:hypothetical protein
MGLTKNLGSLSTVLTELNGNVLLNPNNVVGGTNVYIGQTMANNDWWRIYGNTIANDRGEMIFELGDNAQASSTNGQRFRFFYNNVADGTAKSPFILDYNDAVFNTNASFTGNVGIGTTSPATKLQIEGTGVGAWLTINRTDSGSNIVDFTQSGTRLGYVGYNGNDLLINNATNSNTILYSNNLERMRITSGGNVVISNLGTGNVNSINGALTNGSISDERLKDNIVDFNYGLNEILQLRTVSYVWKNDIANQGTQFGFIAQEVQEVMPELVKEIEIGEEEAVLGLDKEGIYAALVNAVKELKAEIEILKNK